MHYGSVELSTESPDIALSRFRFRERDRFAYLYDMGDFWEHEVRIEKFLERSSKKTSPVCTDGSGACPPEAAAALRDTWNGVRRQRAGMRGQTSTWLPASDNRGGRTPCASNTNRLVNA